jgi:hypothetical protein
MSERFSQCEIAFESARLSFVVSFKFINALFTDSVTVQNTNDDVSAASATGNRFVWHRSSAGHRRHESDERRENGAEGRLRRQRSRIRGTIFHSTTKCDSTRNMAAQTGFGNRFSYGRTQFASVFQFWRSWGTRFYSGYVIAVDVTSRYAAVVRRLEYAADWRRLSELLTHNKSSSSP